MATAKTTALTFPIEPGLKETLRMAAGREYSSITHIVEVMIRDYCVRIGVAISEQGALVHDRPKPAKRSQSARHKRTP